MKIKKYADGSILDFLRKRSKTESIDTIPTVSETDPNFIGPVTPRDASGNLIDFADMKKRQRYAESSFRDNLTSPAGAIGRYQIMPITYKEYNQRTGKTGDLLDPNFNEELRDWYMNTNLNKYNALRRGNPTPLIKEYRRYAAYNMGPVGLNSALNKAIADGIDIDNTIDWISYLPKETQDYINFIVGKQDIQDSSKTTAKYNAAIKKYGIYQKGGLVYNPFVPETKISKQIIDEPTFQSLKISDYTRFPVEPVKTYNVPKEIVPQQVTTQIDDTKVEQPKITKEEAVTGKVYKSDEKQQFKTDIYNAYYDALLERGLDTTTADAFAKRISTQDVLESRWGQSSLSKDFNFGGIKDFSGNGVQKDTTEYINGVKKSVKQPFKKFKDLKDYVNYKLNLVDKNWNVFKYNPDSYYTLITSGKKKYATDPNYVAKLNDLYKQIW